MLHELKSGPSKTENAKPLRREFNDLDHTGYRCGTDWRRGFAFMENTEQGDRVDYHEEVFEIPQQELAGYALYGDFVTTGRKTDGNWRVTFPLETGK